MRDLMLDLVWDLLIVWFGCQTVHYGVQSYMLELSGLPIAAFGATGLMMMGLIFMVISLMGRVRGSQPRLEEIGG